MHVCRAPSVNDTNNESVYYDDEASREGMYLLKLINSKFKALERLVFVLKKKVLMFESNEDLCASLDKCDPQSTRTSKTSTQRTKLPRHTPLSLHAPLLMSL